LKLVTFAHSNRVAIGALLPDSQLISFTAASAHFSEVQGHECLPALADMKAFLSAGDRMLETASELVNVAANVWRDDKGTIARMTDEGVLLNMADVRLMAPVPLPSKIVAVGLNYMDHCREQQVAPPERPLLFTKFPHAVIGPGELITWDPKLTSQVDYEAELAVVIGKRATRVPAKDWSDYVAGYTALNDVSARDLQFGDGQWVRGKSLDSFCPMGPALVTREEVADPQQLKISCRVNERMLQDSSTAEMIFKIPELIEFITQGITLEPGDVIATGTPHGVGVFREPQIFLGHGDHVTVTIEGIGELTNSVYLS
jgi:2-keto-4-pentenoate hydratase/2-oxohepta-3-ene-1,7-dioic acid hydratase in catechol pathway